uniref:MTHFR SAM-binding regulatory domain-containing protein n=1 Tax=Alexandrium catenella TaxID=2925 RepID=A0A7S1S4X7_ALECA
MLVVHSQPRANGVPSTDPDLGWGPPNGLVYQKAYLEFFASHETLQKLAERLSSEEAICYIAANRAGDVKTNVDSETVNAVAWGVFPGAQVKQPVVADYKSFLAWKDEAFSLWSEWVQVYDKASSSRELLESIQASWYLVSVVDDNFVCGDLLQTLFHALGC